MVHVNPNRKNIYLNKKVRLSNHHGKESYTAILQPIANELAIQRETYPMTIIYLKLKYCGYAYSLFERTLEENQFVGETTEPAARLFAQFHSPQTDRMKKEIISEIKKENSRVRILFATSALGIGVDAPYIRNVMHISPPSTIEAYMQEIGRAGRTGLPSNATMYYIMADIANNKVHIEETIKKYCRIEDTCLRKYVLKYFGFNGIKQDNCCCICDKECKSKDSNAVAQPKMTVRTMASSKKKSMKLSINNLLLESLASLEYLALFDCSYVEDLTQNIIEEINYIESESDLINKLGVNWDKTCSSKIFAVICSSTIVCKHH